MTTVPPKRPATGARVVVLVCVGIFMTTLDASIVNIGLPSIARAFGTALTGTLEWIVIGYLVVIGALLVHESLLEAAAHGDGERDLSALAMVSMRRAAVSERA